MTKITRTVETPEEYKELVQSAETLGFELYEHDFDGTWDAEGCPAWPTRGCELEKVGRKYFHIEMDGTTYKCVPEDDAHLTVEFYDS